MAEIEPRSGRINPLRDVPTETLQELWGKADKTPGEVAGGFTKGAIFQELERRNANGGNDDEGGGGLQLGSPATIAQKRMQRTRPRHPIDGSSGMRVPNEVGMRRALSKR